MLLQEIKKLIEKKKKLDETFIKESKELNNKILAYCESEEISPEDLEAASEYYDKMLSCK